MDDRLKNLKKIMDQRTFKDVTFKEKHRTSIFEKVNQTAEREEDIHLAVMQLLVQAKTGYDLTVLLRARGIRKFEHNEGELYTLLHSLEHAGSLQSHWDSIGGKFYQLTDRGKKQLKKAEKQQAKQTVMFKESIEGWQG
jgi:DNA-binding PadR family transcriptional regulator